MDLAPVLSTYHLCSDGIYRRIHLAPPSTAWTQIRTGLLNSGESMREILQMVGVPNPNGFMVNAKIRQVYYYNDRILKVDQGLVSADPIPSNQVHQDHAVLLDKAMLILRKISTLQPVSHIAVAQELVLQIVRNLAI